MNKLHFATIFDKNYISRGLTLYFSISKYCSNFTLYIVALDDYTKKFFEEKSYKYIQVISIKEIELYFSELEQIKTERDFVSYLFTLSPYYPLYILNKNPEIAHICSLDADQCFFSSPQTIFDELELSDVLITPHRFTQNLIDTDIEKYGKFNVSFQVFKNNTIGLECLEFWRNQCFTWCKDILEDGKFADQKYLEEWLNQFPNHVQEINNIGLGLAPWNIDNYKIHRINKQLYVNDIPLILYHYQGLRFYEYGFIYLAFDHYKAKLTYTILHYLYKPLILDILQFQENFIDSISRNKINFYFDAIKKVNRYSYFKLFKGNLIPLSYYIFLKSLRFWK